MRILSAAACLALIAILPNAVRGQGLDAQITTQSQLQNEFDILAYALSLENFEATYYSMYVGTGGDPIPNYQEGGYWPTTGMLSESDFAGFPVGTFEYIQQVAMQEVFHATFLFNVTSSSAYAGAYSNISAILNGTNCNLDGSGGYPFNTSYNATQFINLAAHIEPVGVGAYEAAALGIITPAVLQIAVQISTVEARHASFFALLNGIYAENYMSLDDADAPMYMNPFPSPFGKPLSFVEVGNAVFPYLICDAVAQNLLSFPETTFPEPWTNRTMVNFTAMNATEDLIVLNYALTLESLEFHFYNMFVGLPGTTAMFTVSDFETYFSNFDNTVFNNSGQQIYGLIQLICSHEMTHVQTLNNTIAALGGMNSGYMPASAFNFSTVTDVASFLKTAQTFENVGNAAYNGAANRITNLVVQEVAAEIDAVEAMHASFLNQLWPTTNFEETSGSPFDGPLDIAYEPSTVVSLITPYFATTSSVSSSTTSPPTTSMSSRPSSAVLPSVYGVSLVVVSMFLSVLELF